MTERAPLLKIGNVALITGASSGIGEGFTRALAARGLTLILTGRDPDRLARVANEAASAGQVRVEQIPVDLAEAGAPERLKAAVGDLGLRPDVLINNAGGGLVGTFAELSLDAQLQMVRVNVEALVALTGLFLPEMLARRAGGIINVSSAASFQPIPHFAVYAASKAFVTSFSEALWAETRASGVTVVALCPGPVTDTRFGERAGESPMSRNPAIAKQRSQPREVVVAQGLRALERGDILALPGLANRALAALSGFVPRRIQLAATERLFRPART